MLIIFNFSSSGGATPRISGAVLYEMEDGQGWAIGPVAMTTAGVAATSASATPWLRTREHGESSTADGDGTAAAAAPVHFQWEVVVAVMPTRYEVDDAVSVYYGADTALAAAAIVTAGGTESSAKMTIVPGERYYYYYFIVILNTQHTFIAIYI